MSKSTPKCVSSPVYKPSRKIEPRNLIALFTRAGGRCEFDGCSEYLLEHHVTFEEGNFAEAAHIVAFSEKGPRGEFQTRPDDIHDLSNLMLMCQKCHKLIDDNPDKFSKETLDAYKKNHEEQILYLTGLRPEMKTSVLVVQSKIKDQTVQVPFDHILEATAPRYPLTKKGLLVDLTQLSTKGSSFASAACDAIREQVSAFLSPGREVAESKHISLFALAPMPVLAFLGSLLSNTVPVEVFQRHRDTERWKWKEGTTPVVYGFRQLRPGTDASKAALVVSLSGSVTLDALPAEIDESFSVYEIHPANSDPDPTLIKSKADLDTFRFDYQKAIGTISRVHAGLKTIQLFAAVPAPVAVLCGRELLPRAHPAVTIYDYEKGKGFHSPITINA